MILSLLIYSGVRIPSGIYTESYMTVFMVDGHQDHPDDDGKFQSEHPRDLS